MSASAPDHQSALGLFPGMLPDMLHQALRDHLRLARGQHEADLKRGLGPRASARRPGPQVRERRPRMCLAVGLSCFFTPPRPKDGHPASLPPARIADSEGGTARAPTNFACEPRDNPHISAFISNMSVGGRLGHQDNAATPGTRGLPDHDGLHAGVEPSRVGAHSSFDRLRKAISNEARGIILAGIGFIRVSMHNSYL